jgi:hypothetical protein
MSEVHTSGTGENNLEKVKAFLANQSVARVGVVDDAFDVEDPEDLKSAWKAFVEDAGDKPPLWKQMKRLKLDPGGDEEVEEIASMEATILQGGGELAKLLRRKVKQQSPEAKQQRAGVKNLTQLLETRLALDLVRAGSDAQGKAGDLAEMQIVFLDYFLGEENSSGVKNAIGVVRKVCEVCDQKNIPRPMFVLFSSKDLNASEVNALRRKAQIPAWQFRFIAKKNLARDIDIVLRVWELAQGLKGVRGIQEFVDGFSAALERAQGQLEETLDELDLSDVAYLDYMKLSTERASRSNYLTWLFGAFLQNALLRDKEFQSAQEALDVADLSSLPTRHAEPSRQVLDLYRDVLYEPGIPKVGLEADGKTRAKRLQLGEIYVRQRGQVRDAILVLNASCDLVRPAPGLSVVLLRGALVERRLAKNLGDASQMARSDAFGLGGKHFVLDWSLDNSENVSHAKVFDWLRRGRYKLTSRMRLENALGIKQMFLTQLDRIGVASSPPMLTPLRVAGVFWRDDVDKAQELLGKSATDSMEAFAVDTYSDEGNKDERFAFTSEFLAKLADEIQRKAKAKPGDATLKKLDTWSNNYARLTQLLHPRKKKEMEPVELRLDQPLAAGQSVGKDARLLLICLAYVT